jgi:hypothetical protein
MRYLLITFYRKANGQIDEHVKAGKRVRTSDITSCNIIIDYGLQKVDKCIVEGNKLDRTFFQLNEYYKKVYPAMIAQLEKEGPSLVRQQEKKS